MKALPIGIHSFNKIKSNNYYYVDKTMMIEEFLKNAIEVTLITRPRRFGKTLNMSMLAEFFDITKDSKELFKDTYIINSEYANHINQYPVIFISFASVRGNVSNVIENIKIQLQNEYDRYEYIFNNLSRIKSNQYEKIIDSLFSTNSFLDIPSNTLSFLMECLENYYNKKVIVLIDEYDTPFIEAYNGGFYNEINVPLANLFHNVFKLSDALQYGLLTGIQRVAKENIFSGLNNLIVADVTKKEYASYFGFSENEVKEIMEYYGLEFNDDIKEMYDGYQFGNQDIYNPWSILNYCLTKELEPYWINTSSNMLIRQLIKNADHEFKTQYEELMKYGNINTNLNLSASFYELETNETLWGLFVSSGYLTCSKIKDSEYCLKIPNKEVVSEFKSITAYYLDVSTTLVNQIIKSIINKDKELFIQKYKSLLMIPSYHDLKSENSYHMLLLGLSLWLQKDYEIISNKEEGKGRCDLILKAKHENLPSYVLEFKYLKKEKKYDLEKLANEAIKQIKENQYDEKLKGEITYIGIAHQGKECCVVIEDKDQSH